MSVKALLFSAQESKYPSGGLGWAGSQLVQSQRCFCHTSLSPPALVSPFLSVQALRMVSRKVVASLLLLSLLSVLAEQTQGFMPFFTQSDFQKMQVTPLE